MEQPPKSEEMVPGQEAIRILQEAFNIGFMSRMERALKEGMRKSNPLPIDQGEFLRLADMLGRLKRGELQEIPKSVLATFLQYHANIERAIIEFEARN